MHRTLCARALLTFLVLASADAGAHLDPDDYFFCGKDPSQGPPAIPPLNQDNLHLLQVQVLFRHGDRTSYPWYPTPGTLGSKLQCWPNDTAVWNCTINYLNYPSPNNQVNLVASTGTLFRKVYDSGKNVMAGNCDVGQLTTKGFEQEITNGMMLRNYYTNKLGFLPPELSAENVDTIHVRSDDMPRTVLSAQGILLGLFPPSNSSSNVVVDIHTRSLELGIMGANTVLCPRLQQIYEEAERSPTFVQFLRTTLNPLLQKLSRMLGAPVTYANAFNLLDCVDTHYCNNFPLYPGIDLELIKSMEAAYIWVQNYLNSYPNITYNAKRGIGFLVSEMYEGLQAKLADSSAPNLMLFSGHDTTIMPWLTAYGLLPQPWAGYASVVIVELYTDRDQGEPYVRVIYNQKVLNLPGCGGPLCRWSVYSALSQAAISSDYLGDCTPL